MPAETGHDAVGGALVLELEHRPLARLVGRVEALGDDAVEARPFEPVEPVHRLGPIERGRGQVDRRRGCGQDRLEPAASLRLGHRPQVVVAEGEQIPGDEARRRFGGEHPNARLGRMDAQEQGVEIEPAVGAGDDHLAVEDATLWQRRPERRGRAPGNTDRAA